MRIAPYRSLGKLPFGSGVRGLLLTLAVCALALALPSCSSSDEMVTTTVGSTQTSVAQETETSVSTAPEASDVSTSTDAGKPTTTESARAVYYSPLTGELVTDEADISKPVTGIMVDNHPKARPQSGIADAEIVVEAIAESGITRFLLLFQQNEPDLVGPVRSLRIYDIDWAKPFDCSFAHVGGARSALDEVRNGEYRDIDMFRNSSTYWRSSDRSAPYNVYTSYSKFNALNLKKGYSSSEPIGFSRVDGQPSANPDATSIRIHISTDSFDSSYTYDEATNKYTRSQGQKLFLDREAGQVTPSVVIALMVHEGKGQVEYGILREKITTIGSGDAVVFQNGTAAKVTWHKPGQDDQLTFEDTAGKDFPLVRGQTWIVAVPIEYGGSVSWE